MEILGRLSIPPRIAGTGRSEPPGPETAMKFSIIITIHNQRQFLRDAVGSALALGRHDGEIIVVDDASTDGSQDILKTYGQAIRVLRLNQNGGASVARNCGTEVARGEYLVFLDGDDVFLPWALDVYERVIDLKKPALILGCMRWFKDTLLMRQPEETPDIINLVDYQDYMRKDRPFENSASAIVVNRHSFQSVHGWSEELFPMEDQDLVFRLGDSGRTILVLSPATIMHRAHPGNIVNQVPPFLSALQRLLERERSGFYPGGRKRRLERRALFGGLVFHWAKRASRCGLLWDAAKLVNQCWPMVLTALVRRLHILLVGRCPCGAIPIRDPKPLQSEVFPLAETRS